MENAAACPFCAETIDADAKRCHFCKNSLEGLRPHHGGTCPACKEGIRKEALVCRHCGEVFARAPVTLLRPPGGGGCGCSGRQLESPYVLGQAGSAAGGPHSGPVVKDAMSSSFDGKNTKITVPLSKVLTSRTTGRMAPIRIGPGGPGGGGGLGWSCDWEVALEPCTLCFPFTNWCWEDTCLVIRMNCHSDLT